MPKPIVLIVVEGGIVQNVVSECAVQVAVVDYDKHSDEPVLFHSTYPVERMTRKKIFGEFRAIRKEAMEKNRQEEVSSK